MIYADSCQAVEQARIAFTRKVRCARRVLRTTNVLERINEEFRRRTKTRTSTPSAEAVLFLLVGRLRSGRIALHRAVGWQDLANSNSHADAAQLLYIQSLARRTRMLNAFPPPDRRRARR